MTLKEIMTPEVEVIRPNASLKEAAMKMKDLDVGLIPVCDGDRLWGMLTDRDITVRSTALGNDPAKTAVEEVMTKEVVYSFEDQDESVAAMLMEAKQIRRLIILNRDQRLVGIVSLGDLATRAAHKKPFSCSTSRSVQTGLIPTDLNRHLFYLLVGYEVTEGRICCVGRMLLAVCFNEWPCRELRS